MFQKREKIGYHNIESVFQKVSLYDEIYVSKTNKHKGIDIKSNYKILETQQNIIYKAYDLLKEEFNNITGVDVILIKNIPTQAGMRRRKCRLWQLYRMYK